MDSECKRLLSATSTDGRSRSKWWCGEFTASIDWALASAFGKRVRKAIREKQRIDIGV